MIEPMLTALRNYSLKEEGHDGWIERLEKELADMRIARAEAHRAERAGVVVPLERSPIP